jgi:hypothetical protein
VARNNVSGATVGGNALIAGGSLADNNSTDTVEAYDSQHTRQTIAPLSVARHDMCAVTAGGNALLVGGLNTVGGTTTFCTTIDAYDSSLTRLTPFDLPIAVGEAAGISLGEIAMIGGGADADGRTYKNMYVIDDSLTITETDSMDAARWGIEAARAEELVLFAGGYKSSTKYYYDTVDVYNYA